ncbi:MAG: hypothetical protein IT427_03135 [Pirellulales bacterium]|nr:hypothetical protein [Pirellulales bacterium]
MSNSVSPAVAAESSNASRPTAAVAPPKRRRRWFRWVCGLTVGLILLVIFLPSLAALPMFRGLLFSALFRGLNERVTVDQLSLGWFAPVRAGGVRLQGDQGKPPALAIDEIAGNSTLWNMLTRGELGEFRVDAPQVFLQFDQDGSNWERLIKQFHGAPKLDRSIKLNIVDAKILLQGPTSPAPWSLDKINTHVDFSPAIANSLGVPLITGDKLALLHEAELTPELCNDLLKYIVPSLAGVTTASGRVSLDIDKYSWPVGKPDAANLTGRLTLHSVEIGPGVVTSALAKAAWQGIKIPTSMTVAQNDTVEFWIENGRVHHRDFAFGLIDWQPDRLVRTHGSVGFDQTLDLHMRAPIPGAALLPENALRESLMKQEINVDFGGTLGQPTWNVRLPGGIDLTPARKALGDAFERRRERIQNNPQRPGLFHNRRRGGDESSKPMR